MSRNKFILLIGLLSFGLTGYGQTKLSLEQAIATALEKNHAILVAKNDAQVTGNSAHKGAAGLLPSVDLNAGVNYSLSDARIEIIGSDDAPQDTTGGGGGGFFEIPQGAASAINTTAGLSIAYRLFDGGGGKTRYQVLRRNANLSTTQTEALIEATILQVANSYFTVVRLQDNYQTLVESIEISKDRVDRAKNRQAFGSGNKLAILNAEVDLNTDSASLYTAFLNLSNAKRSLNALIGNGVAEEFEADTLFSLDQSLKLDELLNSAMENNVELRLADYAEQVSELNLKLAKSAYSPTFDVSAGYNFNRTDNDGGSIFQLQQSSGIVVGGSLNFNIFGGNQRKVNVQNSLINLESSKIQADETRLNLERDLANSYFSFRNNLSQLDLEQKSLEFARENFTRTQDAFKLGQATNLQFREAQLNLLRVKNRIDDLRYTAKLNELECYRLSGKLLEGE